MSEHEPPDRSELDDLTPPVTPRGVAEVRDVSFPLAVRGYDRRAVDDYVRRVNQVIAELEVSRSPRAAVRHALDRVGDQVGGILQRARQTAEEIISSARGEAEEVTARARAEAAELVVNASSDADSTRADAAQALASARGQAEAIVREAGEQGERLVAEAREEAAAVEEAARARLRDLERDTAAVWERRTGLLHDVHRLAAELETVASDASRRLDGTTEERQAAAAPAEPRPPADR